MTERLERALKQLSPQELERITEYAESIARRMHVSDAQPQFLSLIWAGKGADLYPEHRSGVEAQHAIADLVRRSIENSLPK